MAKPSYKYALGEYGAAMSISHTKRVMEVVNLLNFESLTIWDEVTTAELSQPSTYDVFMLYAWRKDPVVGMEPAHGDVGSIELGNR